MKVILKNIDELNLKEFDLSKLSSYQLKKVNNIGSLASYYILDKYFKIDLKSIRYVNGKPYINRGYISISHKNNYVAVVYNDYNIGIDIEEIKEYEKSLEKNILTIEEQDYLNESEDKLNDFYKIYTVKECIIKINNWNLKDISSFGVIKDKTIEYGKYSIKYKYLDNYILTIVLEN